MTEATVRSSWDLDKAMLISRTASLKEELGVDVISLVLLDGRGRVYFIYIM